MTDVFIVAAEPSADLQGAHLVQELLKQRPDLQITAVAGPRMRKLPITAAAPMEALQVMGFLDVGLALPRLMQQFFSLRDLILKLNPQAVVCIDYPGFNLRLQKSLRKKGYKGKLIHYICPSVWAWGKRRIGYMEKTLDLLLSIFPFEANFFSRSRLPIAYVGHPLTRSIAKHLPSPHFRTTYQLTEEPILALFPGSRKTEIERNLPLQLQVARQLCEKNANLQIAISIASTDHEAQIWSIAGLKAICIPPEHTYDLMNHSHMAIATSGTVTLELALHSVPTIITYAIKSFDLFLAQKIFRINLPFYCIVNIITSSSVYSELLGPHFTFEKLYDASLKLLQDPITRSECLNGCRKLKELLGDLPASSTAAKKILQTLEYIPK